jgi:hypothetical protein
MIAINTHPVRAFLAAIAVALFVVAGSGAGLAVGAQDASQTADAAGFVGAWQVAVTLDQGSPEVSLGTFSADGTVVTAVSPVLPAPPDAPTAVVFTSGGHGVWEATGSGTAIITFVLLLADEQGQPVGTATVRGRLTLDADAQTFRGEVVRTLADPAGTALATIPGDVQGTRIVAAAPDAAVDGTPTS